jgi:hypothetical protein
MRTLCLILALAASAASAQAPDAPARVDDAAGDPLRSEACRRALAALQAQEAAVAAGERAPGPAVGQRAPAAPAGGAGADAGRAASPDAKLAAAQRHAAAACLRSRADPPPARQPYVQSPIAIEPVPMTRPAPPIARPVAPAPPVVRPAERPRFITTCDAIGCWADDGSRLDRVGPNLRGPRGPCTLQGTLLTCP